MFINITHIITLHILYMQLHMINSNKNLIPEKKNRRKKRRKLLIDSKSQYICISKFFNRKSSIVF